MSCDARQGPPERPSKTPRMRDQHAAMKLSPPLDHRGYKRDPKTPALVPKQIRQARSLVVLVFGQIGIRQLAGRHKQERDPKALQRARPRFLAVIGGEI